MENKISQEESASSPEPKKKVNKKLRKIKLKIVVIFVVIIALGVLAYTAKGLLVVATVNGSPISRLAVVRILEKESGKGLLDSLIIEKLIQTEASAQNIVISDEEVDAEIKKIEDQIVASGDTFEAALAQQGMNPDDLKKQLKVQKQVEKLLADKIKVTDQEVAQYISDNQTVIPEGQEAVIREQIKSQLSSQKINVEAQALISDLKAKAKIKYFVNY